MSERHSVCRAGSGNGQSLLHEEFECYPSSSFEAADLDILLASRLKDLIIEYDSQSVPNGEEVIQNILSLFWRWKSVRQFRTWNQDFEQKVVYQLADLCYWWGISDSAMVSATLHAIYKCDNHFLKLLIGAMVHPAEIDRINYFLNHAYKTRFTFGGWRFVNVPVYPSRQVSPCTLAVMSAIPNLLHLLLRFGAHLTTKSAVDSELECMSNECECSKLIRFALAKFLLRAGKYGMDFSEALENLSMRNLIACCRILLRVTPQVKKHSLQFIPFRYEGGRFTSAKNINEIVKKLVHHDLLPKLKERYLEPSELKHLCRCVVRKRLSDNWQLPHGIFSLSIPVTLHHYIDLMED